MQSLPDPLLDIVNPLLSAALILIGFLCLLTCRRLLKQVIGLNIMLQGALLNLVDAARVQGDLELVQSLVVSALVAETIVLAIVLALTINALRYFPSGEVDDLRTLRG